MAASECILSFETPNTPRVKYIVRIVRRINISDLQFSLPAQHQSEAPAEWAQPRRQDLPGRQWPWDISQVIYYNIERKTILSNSVNIEKSKLYNHVSTYSLPKSAVKLRPRTADTNLNLINNNKSREEEEEEEKKMKVSKRRSYHPQDFLSKVI